MAEWEYEFEYGELDVSVAVPGVFQWDLGGYAWVVLVGCLGRGEGDFQRQHGEGGGRGKEGAVVMGWIGGKECVGRGGR